MLNSQVFILFCRLKPNTIIILLLKLFQLWPLGASSGSLLFFQQALLLLLLLPVLTFWNDRRLKAHPPFSCLSHGINRFPYEPEFLYWTPVSRLQAFSLLLQSLFLDFSAQVGNTSILMYMCTNMCIFPSILYLKP